MTTLAASLETTSENTLFRIFNVFLYDVERNILEHYKISIGKCGARLYDQLHTVTFVWSRDCVLDCVTNTDFLRYLNGKLGRDEYITVTDDMLESLMPSTIIKTANQNT